MTRFSSSLKKLSQLFRIPFSNALRTPVLLTFLLTCVTILLVLIYYFSLQPVVPLFYSLAQPDDFLVNKIWLIIFPIMSTLILLIHLAMLNSLAQYEKTIQQLYIWVTMAIQFLLLLALIRILWIIT